VLEEIDDQFTSTGKMVEQPGEREEGPTSTDVTDKQISIGEAPGVIPQEEKLQEQKEPRISKSRQRRRTTSYLSDITKRVDKQGNQINKIITIIQSVQKQRQTKSIKAAAEDKSQLQSIKDIQSQLTQLQKQVTRIQHYIQRVRITSGSRTSTRAKFKKLASSNANIKPRPKKSKSLKRIKIGRGRRSR
jgi:hypothetical protein